MKTYRSTVNRFLLYALALISAAIVLTTLPQLQPYRASISSALGMPVQYFAPLVYTIAMITIALMAGNLHGRLSKPIREIADQCASGQLANPRSNSSTRETRVIKEYIRQIQDRADQRADQIQRMETEIIATRRERDRAFRKLEEYEDLLASYNRIRTELEIDNKAYRKDNQALNENVDALRQELRSLKKRPDYASVDFLNELMLMANQISNLSCEIAAQWEKRSLSSIRESLYTISERCEQQKSSIEFALSERDKAAKEDIATFPVERDLQRILEQEQTSDIELLVTDEQHLIERTPDQRTLSFLKGFTQLVSHEIEHGKLAIRIEEPESPRPSLSLTLQTEEELGPKISHDSLSELAKQHGVETDAIDASGNKLRLSFPLPLLQAH